ncbi:hypothetical protein M885DRAFT_568567 [Pelagophyceae sp. CCMP2097]|nr:hypothetical protein M885DRAFT_568567 [Pelagophyceae sp. CCMP2097]
MFCIVKVCVRPGTGDLKSKFMTILEGDLLTLLEKQFPPRVVPPGVLLVARETLRRFDNGSLLPELRAAEGPHAHEHEPMEIGDDELVEGTAVRADVPEKGGTESPKRKRRNPAPLAGVKAATDAARG